MSCSFSYEIVDKIITGPSLFSVDGNIGPEFGLPGFDMPSKDDLDTYLLEQGVSYVESVERFMYQRISPGQHSNERKVWRESRQALCIVHKRQRCRNADLDRAYHGIQNVAPLSLLAVCPALA